MSRSRLVILMVVAAMIVITLVMSPNNNNEVEDIKPYIQEIALRDGMEISNSMDLKKNFGIGTGEVEGFVLYEGTRDGDVREVLVAKLSDEAEVTELRKQLRIRLHQQLNDISETGDEARTLLKHARIITRGRFIMVAVGNDSREIARAFVGAVRK